MRKRKIRLAIILGSVAVLSILFGPALYRWLFMPQGTERLYRACLAYVEADRKLVELPGESRSVSFWKVLETTQARLAAHETAMLDAFVSLRAVHDIGEGEAREQALAQLANEREGTFGILPKARHPKELGELKLSVDGLIASISRSKKKDAKLWQKAIELKTTLQKLEDVWQVVANMAGGVPAGWPPPS